MGIEVTSVSVVEDERVYECSHCEKLHLDEEDAVWCCSPAGEYEGSACSECGKLFKTPNATCSHEIKNCTQCGKRIHGDNSCCEELF